MSVAVVTLVVGIVLGYMGQRSRMCFIGGIRDYILVRDTALLRGLGAFGITAALAFPLARAVAGGPAPSLALSDVATVLLTVAGGFGVGLFSTLANGCPFRQHVLAAQGVVSSAGYLAGFAVGGILFHAWLLPALLRLLP